MDEGREGKEGRRLTLRLSLLSFPSFSSLLFSFLYFLSLELLLVIIGVDGGVLRLRLVAVDGLVGG